MINVVVPTSGVRRVRQAERVVGAHVRFGYGRNLRAMWSCLCAAGTATLVFALAACGEVAQLPVTAGTGPSPALPPPQHALTSTVSIAPAKGWQSGVTPQAAPGTSVRAFARDLDHPRWLYVLPNGDVLVAETNAPSKPDDGNGIQGWLMGLVMERAGAGVPRTNRITLLRDADGDGVAEIRSVLIESVNSPFGMALVGEQLYVAASDAVLRFPYVAGATRIVDPGTKVVDLPAGALHHSWAKKLIAGTDGTKLYVTVGSNGNVAERGMAVEEGRAAIREVDTRSGAHRAFAGGLPNPNGLPWEPRSDALWTVVNEPDEFDNDLGPDHMTSVRRDGVFFGWPNSYYGQHVDDRVAPPRRDLLATAIAPDYALGAHTASLGLAASGGNTLPATYADGMFVGQHGSWNRGPHSGYKVIFVPFENGKPSGEAPADVLTGFLSDDGDAFGRLAGVFLDNQGALLVADDVGNAIWRVTSRR